MITTKGYIRVWYEGRLRMMHDIVWEKNNGKIPKGKCIHHKDENKQNNVIGNLELKTAKEHKRWHRGGIKTKNGWSFECTKCGKVKKESEFYRTGKGRWPMSECKKCHIGRAVRDKQRKRHESKSQIHGAI